MCKLKYLARMYLTCSVPRRSHVHHRTTAAGYSYSFKIDSPGGHSHVRDALDCLAPYKSQYYAGNS